MNNKLNEKDYLKKIGDAGIKHALNKPFSDINCGALLSEIGAIISLLPKNDNLKILDMGCGTGYTSYFFAQKGHEVLGIDISEDMIKYAKVNKGRYNLTNLNFEICDSEEMKFYSQFDCVVFIDSLHHCRQEEKVIENAYKALKPGGICIISEPGQFHEKSPNSVRAKKDFGVLERDMPPLLTRKLGKKIGFKKIKTYPRSLYLNFILYSKTTNLPNFPIIRKLLNYSFTRTLGALLLITLYKRYDGIVVMTK